MSTIEITQDNFESTINDNEIILLDFWADWCGPCKQFAPVFEQAAEANPDIVFGKIDTEAQQQLAGLFAISSIPTLVAFRQGIVVFAQPGALAARSSNRSSPPSRDSTWTRSVPNWPNRKPPLPQRPTARTVPTPIRSPPTRASTSDRDQQQRPHPLGQPRRTRFRGRLGRALRRG